MKKVLFLLCLISFHTMAQKKNLTLQEAVLGMNSSLALKSIKQLKWMGSSETYSYVVDNDSEKVILKIDPSTFEPETMISLEKMNQLLQVKSIKKLATIPEITWIDGTSFYILHENQYVVFRTAAGQVPMEVMVVQPESAESAMFHEKSRQVAYVMENNIYINNQQQNTIQLTKDGSSDIAYGVSVHRNEFGIDKGLFWSPSGNALAFYRMDQTMVEDYPVVNWSAVPATVKMIKYPFAGRKSHHVTLGIYHVSSQKMVYLQTDEPAEQYWTTVTWSPDDKFIYVSLLNREQNHLRLKVYDANTGELVKTLFEEKNDRYVEPQNALYFINNDPSKFIWWSQRDGYMHLYLYSNDGILIRQVTQGPWLVNEILGYNAKTGELFFTSSKESPMQKNVYAVALANGKMRLLSSTLGSHTASLSANGNFLIDQYNNRNTPRNIEVKNCNTLAEKRILTATNTLTDYKLANVENVKLYTADSTLLYGKLMTPYDFDATKRYPVIVYLYNGPHVQLNKDVFPYSGNLWYDYMTQRGYVVFVVDGRGSSNRGFAFESAVHRQLGTLEMEDQLTGVRYLKSLPYVDTNRFGVHGWSFGGFMTTSLMLRKPGVFKVGVAGGPVLDWSMYEVMYTERYMDMPTENPDGYKANVLLDKVDQLKGKLLMIHGTDDDVVVWQHSLLFQKNCVSKGVQMDYYVYPGHPHNVRGKDRVHLMQKITDYFDTNLK
ncbi:MAG TPA: DPP IV N-terminal domain-containing protein [Chitinophagaceae bacterium]|nr:DPP IV N-terminal domain-containing protein [Chitinophagaceae bacterium]